MFFRDMAEKLKKEIKREQRKKNMGKIAAGTALGMMAAAVAGMLLASGRKNKARKAGKCPGHMSGGMNMKEKAEHSLRRLKISGKHVLKGFKKAMGQGTKVKAWNMEVGEEPETTIEKAAKEAADAMDSDTTASQRAQDQTTPDTTKPGTPEDI